MDPTRPQYDELAAIDLSNTIRRMISQSGFCMSVDTKTPTPCSHRCMPVYLKFRKAGDPLIPLESLTRTLENIPDQYGHEARVYLLAESVANTTTLSPDEPGTTAPAAVQNDLKSIGGQALQPPPPPDAQAVVLIAKRTLEYSDYIVMRTVFLLFVSLVVLLYLTLR